MNKPITAKSLSLILDGIFCLKDSIQWAAKERNSSIVHIMAVLADSLDQYFKAGVFDDNSLAYNRKTLRAIELYAEINALGFVATNAQIIKRAIAQCD